jgi:RNA polymerase sigma-70 factor (ECF subfamily)
MDGMDSSQNSVTPNKSPSSFATTHWSLIVCAGEQDRPVAHQALSELCGRYWYPLYAFLRRGGNDHDQAQDLVQGFFLELIEHARIAAADPERGRFRTFLLASLKNYQANERRTYQTIKRGGKAIQVSINFSVGQQLYDNEPFHSLTPEKLYERKWALQLIQRCLGQLETEAQSAGRGALFEKVKPLFHGEDADAGYQQIASELGMSAGAIKVAVHRWRDKFRSLIRDEIRHTVTTEVEVDDEVELLFAAIVG